MSEVRIRPLERGDEEAFRRLNEEWIERYFSLEEKDREVLGDPQGAILERGGTVLIAEVEGAAAGCCALVPLRPGVLELVKMAVTERYQGRGLGHSLLQAAIETARTMGAERVVLETSSKLGPALRLYERAGFARIEPVYQSPYQRSDVWMERSL